MHTQNVMKMENVQDIYGIYWKCNSIEYPKYKNIDIVVYEICIEKY